jgi:hypothetical protein
MDFLLIVLAVGGFVVAIVMLLLAVRAKRLQEESDERVDTLEAMATGSVLFASVSPADATPAPAESPSWLADDLDFSLDEFADEDELLRGDAIERAPPPVAAAASPAAPAAAYPFVMTVPATAGAARAHVSFDLERSRSHS